MEIVVRKTQEKNFHFLLFKAATDFRAHLKSPILLSLSLILISLNSCNSKVFDPQAARAAITILGPEPVISSVSPSSWGVRGGTVITITGNYLSDTESVNLGGSECNSIIVNSDTEITCEITAHQAAAVNVVVVNSSQQTGTLENGFKYNSFLYTSAQSSSSIAGYVVDATTGGMTSVGPAATACTGAYGVEIDPTNQLLVTACVSTSQLKAYLINEGTGVLTQVATVTAGSGVNGLKFTSNGQMILASNWSANSLTSYSTSISAPTATLSPLYTVSTGTNPGGIAIGKNNSTVYTANYGSNSISGYVLSAGGSMTPISGSPWTTGTGPDGLVIHPSGKFLYSGNASGSNVSAFSIDQSSGALTFIANYSIQNATGGAGLEMDDTGTHLYVTSMAAGKLNAFTINSLTGALSALSTPFFSAQVGANDVRIQKSGAFVFTANTASNSISAFIRDLSTGLLTPASTPNFVTGNSPGIIAITY